MTMFPEFATAARDELLEPRILRAIADYEGTSGEKYSVVRKNKTLTKFGRSLNIDNTGYKTVWAGTEINDEPPNFGDPSTGNLIDSVVSETGGDDQVLRIEGHTIANAVDLTFTVQTATLNGQTPVTLTTPLHTVTRIVNTSATELTGPVYVYDNTDGQSLGIPTDPTDVGGYLEGTAIDGGQQTEQAFTAVSSVDLWIVTQLIVSANRANSAAYDVEFQRRSTSGVWLPMELEIAVDTTASSTVILDLNPCLLVQPNTYVRAQAISSSATDGEVSAAMGGYLALNVD